jgi:hypothetical protein
MRASLFVARRFSFIRRSPVGRGGGGAQRRAQRTTRSRRPPTNTHSSRTPTSIDGRRCSAQLAAIEREGARAHRHARVDSTTTTGARRRETRGATEPADCRRTRIHRSRCLLLASAHLVPILVSSRRAASSTRLLARRIDAHARVHMLMHPPHLCILISPHLCANIRLLRVTPRLVVCAPFSSLCLLGPPASISRRGH